MMRGCLTEPLDCKRYLHKIRKERCDLKENKRKIGTRYEEKAASFLEEKGLLIKERNYRCRLGEVDLIAQDGACLVFVEVKYRSCKQNGGALAAVDFRKQKKLTKAAQFYLMSHYGSMDISCRFDVVGIDGKEIRWIENAFEAC